MPIIGGRHFDYSKAGRAAAARYKKRTGKTTKHSPSSDRQAAKAVRQSSKRK